MKTSRLRTDADAAFHPVPAGYPDEPNAFAVFRHPVFWASFLGGFLWCLVFMLLSDGWSLDDEISHYLRSRSVWENPPLIFDAWTRIGRNLFHLLPAHFGLFTARLWTLLTAAGAVWLTNLLAQRMGVKRTWWIPLLLWFQPWFVELSWGVLTQTPFLIALLAGIWFLTDHRLALSGFCFGLLPLIRHEGIALLGLWGLAVTVQQILHRRPHPLPLAFLSAAVPLIAYNASAWIVLGEIPSRVYFEPKPTEIYGSGTLWHFSLVCLVPAGICSVLLAAIGFLPACRERKLTWPLGFYLAYFALHSVIFWKGLFASGGYYHFIMPAAPGLAVLAAFGVDHLLDRPRPWTRLAGILLIGALLQGLVLLHVLTMQVWAGIPPQLGLARDPIHHLLDEALDWQAAHRPDAPVACRHVYAAYARDWIETPSQRAFFQQTPTELPPGTILIWEAKYADVTGFPLNDLRSPEWHLLRDFGTVKILEKRSSAPEL